MMSLLVFAQVAYLAVELNGVRLIPWLQSRVNGLNNIGGPIE